MIIIIIIMLKNATVPAKIPTIMLVDRLFSSSIKISTYVAILSRIGDFKSLETDCVFAQHSYLYVTT